MQYNKKRMNSRKNKLYNHQNQIFKQTQSQ